jgi:hypothetical protein
MGVKGIISLLVKQIIFCPLKQTNGHTSERVDIFMYLRSEVSKDNNIGIELWKN